MDEPTTSTRTAEPIWVTSTAYQQHLEAQLAAYKRLARRWETLAWSMMALATAALGVIVALLWQLHGG